MTDPRKIHELEQKSAPFFELAYMMGVYHRALMVQGFTREEATRVVLSYQSDVFKSTLGGPR